MAGHSKWANIRHRKGAQDIKRGKIFGKLVKEISMAVKVGGSDPSANPRLRTAIQNARGQNVPKDNIEKAIKKAAGGEGAALEEVTFEGYGPGGVAVFVECTTDNNTRTVGNIRSAFKKYGGSLGKDGCLEFIFSQIGLFVFEREDLEEEEFSLQMIDMGAEDVEFFENVVRVTTGREDYGLFQKKLQEMGLGPKEAGLHRIPTTSKFVDQKISQELIKLIDALEDDDDVQRVYENAQWEGER